MNHSIHDRLTSMHYIIYSNPKPPIFLHLGKQTANAGQEMARSTSLSTLSISVRNSVASCHSARSLRKAVLWPPVAALGFKRRHHAFVAAKLACAAASSRDGTVINMYFRAFSETLGCLRSTRTSECRESKIQPAALSFSRDLQSCAAVSRSARGWMRAFSSHF